MRSRDTVLYFRGCTGVRLPCRPFRDRQADPCLGASGVVVGEAGGQVAVRVCLVEQMPGPCLEGGDRIGAGGEAQRRLVLSGEVDQRVGELGGVAALLTFMLCQAVTVCLVRSA